TVMSDSDESGVTHTKISSPFEDLSDIGSPGVEDEVFPAEEQPLPATASPTAQSPDYDDEDDDEVDIEADDDVEDEEEEHLALADSAVVALPAADQAPSAEETEPFEIDESAATPPPHPAYRVTSRILFQLQYLHQYVSSPVLVLSPSPPASPIRPLGYRAAMILLRAEAVSTPHSLPLPLPIILSHTRPAVPSSGKPPLHLLSTDHREDRPEVTLLPRKRLGIAFGPAYEVGESSSAAAARPDGGLRADYGFVATMDREIRRDLERDVRYGITDLWHEIVETVQGAPVSTDTELGRHMTSFETRVRDRRAHARTSRLMETKARMSREAWGRSMDASDLARAEETDGDFRDAGGRLQETEAAHRGIEADKETSDLDGRKMAPKRATRSNIALETTNTTSVTNAQLQAMINQGVTAALVARDANTNDVDNHNSGTGARRNERATRECTYPDFMKCQPLNFKGTEGVFFTCTLLGNALTWWNSHVRIVGNDVAYAMTWTELKRKIIDKYCPRTEIKKLKVELWELKVEGTDVIGYNQRFQELALLYGKMFPEESDKIEKYVGGLPDMVHESVVASKPKTMQEATEMEIEVMDKRIRTFADRQTLSKRKFEDTSRNT
ncbi:reverse transcriptase domain-containing protein, partial [Tanacetum coccineum]